MRKLAWLLWLITILCVTCITYVAADSAKHTEDFDKPELSKEWHWIHEDKDSWSLTKNPGHITITTKVGDIWGGINDASNVLLLSVPCGNVDFEFTTKIEFNPTANWHQLGLLVCQDLDNYIVLKALYSDGQKLQWGKEVKAYFTSMSAVAQFPQVQYLRITRKNGVYTGYYSKDNIRWTEVGSYSDVILNNISVGYLVCNGGSSQIPSTDAKIGWLNITYDEKAAVLPKAPDTRALTYTNAPVENPLKGFMPYLDARNVTKPGRDNYDRFPYSMEYFYMPLRQLMVDNNKFDWSDLEMNLNSIASRGNQAVFRIYLDYPQRATGIPDFLLKNGLKTYKYSQFGGGTCPDYNDPRLLQALDNFIAALGAKYDGDPRIGFIQIGLIGFWGEWHTTGSDWMPTVDNQNRILTSYDRAFNKTKILVRYPVGDSPYMDIGYHDDSFAYQTIGTSDDSFLSLLKSANMETNWKMAPVGGEMRPEIQISMWKYTPPKGLEDYNTCAELTHASWLLNQGVFDQPPTGLKWCRAMEAARRLGYELFVPKSFLFYTIKKDTPIKLGVQIQNVGIAPFYYDWKVQLGIRNSSGEVIKTFDTNWRLSKILPGPKPVDLEYTIEHPGLEIGSYTMVMRVVNPLKNGKKLMFANVEQGDNGWLDLGAFQITRE
ncbi:MAG: DUF4832 domain-containing protein [Bacillota bacterium]